MSSPVNKTSLGAGSHLWTTECTAPFFDWGLWSQIWGCWFSSQMLHPAITNQLNHIIFKKQRGITEATKSDVLYASPWNFVCKGYEQNQSPWPLELLQQSFCLSDHQSCVPLGYTVIISLWVPQVTKAATTLVSRFKNGATWLTRLKVGKVLLEDGSWNASAKHFQLTLTIYLDLSGQTSVSAPLFTECTRYAEARPMTQPQSWSSNCGKGFPGDKCKWWCTQLFPITPTHRNK